MGPYGYILKKSGLDPLCTIFVDDKVEYFLTARSFGLRGMMLTMLFRDYEMPVKTQSLEGKYSCEPSARNYCP